MEGAQNQLIGAWGETEAVHLLMKKGYVIITRNFRTRYGELDIIAWTKVRNEKTLSFIEVKTRTSGVGSAERATGKDKLDHLRCAVQIFCDRSGIAIGSVPMQFEQVSVYIRNERVFCSHKVIPF